MNKQAIAETQTQYVQMEKAKLLDVVKANRSTHLQDWEKAHSKWKMKQIEKLNKYAKKLERAIESAVAGKKIAWPNQRSFQLDEPQSRVKDYDRTIRRLELSIDENMYLTHDDFDRYVMDEWSWKKAFALTNSAYMGD